jgi:cytochrome c oxidase subunit 3
MSNQYHCYHIVTPSPWPAFGALSALVTTMGGASYFHGYIGGDLMLLLGISMLGVTMLVWWRDVIREATFQGHHTLEVQTGIKEGVILFIVSEALLFFSFFWAYFHSSLSPSVELGAVW